MESQRLYDPCLSDRSSIRSGLTASHEVELFSVGKELFLFECEEKGVSCTVAGGQRMSSRMSESEVMVSIYIYI